MSATFSIQSWSVLVVGEVVVALGDADVVERAVAAVVGEQQGRDARRVGLERQDEHVVHELDVLRVVRRDARRRLDGRVVGLAEPLGLLDARLDLADAGQVLVELLRGPAASEPALHRAGVVEDEVEDWTAARGGGVAGSPARSPGGPGAEEPLEERAAGWAPAASASSASSRRG